MRKIAALWHNNLRFASEDSLRAHLKRIGRLRGIRGDALKKNSADLLLAAELIVEEGARFMDLKAKVEKALRNHFQVEHLDLGDYDGSSVSLSLPTSMACRARTAIRGSLAPCAIRR